MDLQVGYAVAIGDGPLPWRGMGVGLAGEPLGHPGAPGRPCRRDQTPGKSGRFGAALAGAGHSLQKAS